MYHKVSHKVKQTFLKNVILTVHGNIHVNWSNTQYQYRLWDDGTESSTEEKNLGVPVHIKLYIT